MRGTDNQAAYDAFVVGERIFTLASEQATAWSQECFEIATQLDENYARAWCELSYTYVRRWLQGWCDDSALQKAETAAKRAAQLDPNDYRCHWALAFYHLNTGVFDLALEEFERAMSLNEDHNPELPADMAEAMVAAGRHEMAIELIEQSRRIPDWNRWNLAWACYFNARTATDCKDVGGFYDRALNEIAQMRHQPGDAEYLIDAQLLVAACHAQKGDQAAARRALQTFLQYRPGWTIKKERHSVSFKHAEDERYWLDGIFKAGLR